MLLQTKATFILSDLTANQWLVRMKDIVLPAVSL